MRFGTQFIVYFDRLAHNVDLLRSHIKGPEILFMVKADGYGHGAIPLVEFANRELNIKEFGLATLGEALALRQQLPSLNFEAYVFSDLNFSIPGMLEYYGENRILPVVHNERDLKIFLGAPQLRHFPLILKFNTGMNRLGLAPERQEEIIKMIKQVGRTSIYHLMTHFACASLNMKNAQNQRQIASFAAIKSQFKAANISIERTSISNSGAIEQNVGLDETHIRPGLMLYGPSSLIPSIRSKSWWHGKVISCFETLVLNSFLVAKGQPIGYGGTPVKEAGVLGVLSVGYGDGFSTRYQGVTLKDGKLCGEVVGRVNMDMIQVLFPNGTELDIGTNFKIWDEEEAQIEQFCKETGVIPYEIFCQMGPRVPRYYK